MICQSVRHRFRSNSGPTFLLKASRSFSPRSEPYSRMVSTLLSNCSMRTTTATKHATKAAHTYQRIAFLARNQLYAASNNHPAHPTVTAGRITHDTRRSGRCSNHSSTITEEQNTPKSRAIQVCHRDQALRPRFFSAFTFPPASSIAGVACGAICSQRLANSRRSRRPDRQRSIAADT